MKIRNRALNAHWAVGMVCNKTGYYYFPQAISDLTGRQNVNALERQVDKAQAHVVRYLAHDEKLKKQEKRVGWMARMKHTFLDETGLS